jgi:Ni/Co efflux regulator RcnB
MRKLLISLLLASAAASPALADPHDSNRQQAQEDREQAHQERQQAREERQHARAESRGNAQAARPQVTGPRQAPEMRQQMVNGGGGMPQVDARPRGRFDGNAGARFNGNAGAVVEDNGVRRFQGDPRVRVEQNQQVYVAPGPRMVTAPRSFDGRERVRGQRVGSGDFRQSDRAVPNVMRQRNPLVVSNVPRPGTQPPLRFEGGRHHDVHWNTNWRNDHRYDWRERRRHHGSLFHFGIFIDPFGWDYQPFDIGYRMWPQYYGNQYWIDPGVYGLPYPPPGAVWIRYWNDAILVDTYSGTVIDVIPGFFW